MANLGNPQETIAVLQRYGFNFQKKYGQNFLIDTHVLDKIIGAAEIGKDDFVLEIGPGIGTMTQYLAEAAREVVAVEIDTKLIPILEDTLKEYDNVTVLNEDILKVDIRKIAEEKNGGKPIKVVANLPYYITTPIIMGLFESEVPLDSITVMVQKEVADRMQVGPGTKDYGALSLAVQYYAKPYIVANVPPNCFMPRPKVGSAVIRLERYENPPVTVEDEKLMFRLIRASFNQRRKTLQNSVSHDPGLGISKKAKVILSPSGYVYLDHKYLEPSADSTQNAEQERLGMAAYEKQTIQEMYDWDPMTFNPTVENPQKDVAGIEAAIWCETITNFRDLQFLLMPCLAGVAEKGWSKVENTHWDEYKVRLGAQAPLWEKADWNYFKSSLVDWK